MSDEHKEAVEHRDALLDIAAILATSSGKRFFKYLFKELQVGELPAQGVEGNYLMDTLGFLRAGNAIFKLVAEADAGKAGEILAKIEREKYDELYKESHTGQS